MSEDQAPYVAGEAVSPAPEGRCASCKWWNTEFVEHPPGWGYCDMMDEEWSAGNPPVKKVLSMDKALTLTAPDFGCTEWEAR